MDRFSAPRRGVRPGKRQEVLAPAGRGQKKLLLARWGQNDFAGWGQDMFPKTPLEARTRTTIGSHDTVSSIQRDVRNSMVVVSAVLGGGERASWCCVPSVSSSASNAEGAAMSTGIKAVVRFPDGADCGSYSRGWAICACPGHRPCGLCQGRSLGSIAGPVMCRRRSGRPAGGRFRRRASSTGLRGRPGRPGSAR
jgi:hypothetical protein